MTQDIAFSYAPDLRPAFLAHMASRLDALICKQTKQLYEDAGVKTPVRSVSVVAHLHRRGSASIAEIARMEGQSHQLVSSRVAPLEALGLIKIMPDPNDERCKVLSLTPTGKADARKAEQICADVAAVFCNLNKELGVDLMSAIEQAEKSLSRIPIEERDAFVNRRKKPASKRKMKERA